MPQAPNRETDALRMLRAILGICDMANPQSPHFADSADECLRELLLFEPEIREVVARHFPAINGA